MTKADDSKTENAESSQAHRIPPLLSGDRVFNMEPENTSSTIQIYRILYHGTNTKEKVDSVLQTGFKAGTYFAKDLADSLAYGGHWVFSVCFPNDKVDEWYKNSRTWQLITRAVIPPDKIVRLEYYPPHEELMVNTKLAQMIGHRGLIEEHYCPICGESIGIDTTKEDEFRALLAMHIRNRHPQFWKGNLIASIETLEETPL